MTLILLTDGAHRRNSFARVKQKYSNSYLGARENSKYSFVLYFLMTKNLSLSSAFPVHLGISVGAVVKFKKKCTG